MIKSVHLIKDLFLSHSHLDKEFVRQLATDCNKKGVSVWLDEAELLIGDSLIKKIQSGIDESRFFALVISPNSENSAWVQKELEQAMDREIFEKNVRILPILLGKVARLPGFLRSKVYADFSGWPSDQKQYNNSLELLVQSILERKRLELIEANDERNITIELNSNSDKIAEDIGNVLIQLAESDVVAWNVVKSLANAFDNQPDKVRTTLFGLAEKSRMTSVVCEVLDLIFDKLTVVWQNKFLLRLADSPHGSKYLAEVVGKHFKSINYDVRNTVLAKIVDKEEAAVTISWTLDRYFNELPLDVRENLILKLCDSDLAANSVALITDKYFNNITKTVRNNVLLKLVNKERAVVTVTKIIVTYYSRLPKEIHDLLFKLGEHENYAKEIAATIKQQSTCLPENLKDLPNQILTNIKDRRKKQ